MRISDWSSDVCSSDLEPGLHPRNGRSGRALALRRALRMDDAAPCGHQIARARMDRRIGAEAVAMVDRAFEEIGQSRQVDMRVRAHVHALPDVEMRGAELVDEDEGADQNGRAQG